MKKIIIAIIIIIILVQFIQPPLNKGSLHSANDFTHEVAVPDTVMAIMKVACFDCHSDSTRYPWYNHITPVNWWLRNHVNGGKRSLNFSAFTTYTFKKRLHRMDDIAKTVKEHDMPLSSYLWIHKDAKLTDGQIK